MINTNTRIRCIKYNNNGNEICIGTKNGKILIYSNDLNTKIKEVIISKSIIQTIQYSPNNKIVAVGSHDCNIYIINTNNYNIVTKLLGHHSYITALDFSLDNYTIQSNSGDYELLYWNVNNGKQINNINDMKDVVWSTCSCTLGWGVQGIWPPNADGTDVSLCMFVRGCGDGGACICVDGCGWMCMCVFLFVCEYND